ncbi:YrdC domain-containing protein, mitochondrial [Thelohanellus kitauei]|uniref:Threonylcarbamoyl-AMP synthase n=1 Tax=Thelohanellus kitauei TaxID=669202 RepID=A0A0C2J8F3_THEKT|nr:YrdC domain-containing protein, mitochondrial [Thelohanellus kitauei]
MSNMLHLDDNECEIIEKAVGVLTCGGVIAAPTDTLYGIGCLLSFSESIDRIYAIKKRDFSKPLAICISDFDHNKLFKNCHMPLEKIRELLPGKFTLIFERSDTLNRSLNPGVGEIGVRFTECEIIQEIIRKCGEPLVLTSANLSGGPNPNCVEVIEI